MCRWSVQSTFVYAVDDSVAEGADDAESDAGDSLCHRIRASSDSMTMLRSLSRDSSMEDCETFAPSSRQPTAFDCATPLVRLGSGMPSIVGLSKASKTVGGDLPTGSDSPTSPAATRASTFPGAMRRWSVKHTFVDVADSDDEGSDDSESDSPCHRIRASSDGLTMLISWSRMTSMEECDTATPNSTRPTDVGCSTPSECCDACGFGMAESPEANGDTTPVGAAIFTSDVVALAFEEEGCQILRQALELAQPAEARGIAEQLHGFALRAALCPRAELVLQKVICHLGTEDAAFIAEELAPEARAVAQSSSGFSVIQRLLEFSPEDRRTAALTDRILAEDLPGMLCHKFGHRVVVSVLSNGLRHQVARVVDALMSDLQRFARHRFASRVLEAAMLHAAEEERASLARALMEQAGAVARLACHAFGVDVVRAMLEVPVEGERAMHYLTKAQRRVGKDRYGLELLQGLGMERSVGDGAADELVGSAVMGGA